MKKITNTIILLLFMFITLNSNAQFKSESSLEFGYFNAIYTVYDRDKIGIPTTGHYYLSPMFADISYGLNYKSFKFYTNVATYFKYIHSYSFRPMQVEYKIGISYNYKMLTFKTEHLCSHSIQVNKFRYGYDKVSVLINFLH